MASLPEWDERTVSAPKGKAMPIAALIGMAHPDHEGGDGDGEAGSFDEAAEMAFQAIKDDDVEGFKKALDQCIDFCMGKGDDGGEGEKEEY